MVTEFYFIQIIDLQMFPKIIKFLEERFIQRDTDKILNDYHEILLQCQQLYESKREDVRYTYYFFKYFIKDIDD